MSDHETITGHYCGQVQPHNAHTWETPPTYGSATFISIYQCAGASMTDAASAAFLRAAKDVSKAARIHEDSIRRASQPRNSPEVTR